LRQATRGLGPPLFAKDKEHVRDFKPRDVAACVLVAHGNIWVFELTKLEVIEVRDERTRWLRLFKEGEMLDDAALPQWMHTDEMRRAMSTQGGVSEKERAYHAYQARQNYLRQQSAVQGELEELRREAEQESRKAEEERCKAGLPSRSGTLCSLPFIMPSPSRARGRWSRQTIVTIARRPHGRGACTYATGWAWTSKRRFWASITDGAERHQAIICRGERAMAWWAAARLGAGQPSGYRALRIDPHATGWDTSRPYLISRHP